MSSGVRDALQIYDNLHRAPRAWHYYLYQLACQLEREGKSLVDFYTELVNETDLGAIENSAVQGFDVPDSINSLLRDIGKIRANYHKEQLASKTFSRGMVYFSAAETVKNNEFADVGIVMLKAVSQKDITVSANVSASSESNKLTLKGTISNDRFSKEIQSLVSMLSTILSGILTIVTAIFQLRQMIRRGT